MESDKVFAKSRKRWSRVQTKASYHDAECGSVLWIDCSGMSVLYIYSM